ncbi:transcriptional regulator, TetR family [Natronincola peptidivorans]|uniref:Transcriptional regulator, TetR family n=1 Tax=Natronincola peptidivorans TaxID=426128 RepID=A0A1I0DR65_9FIRM|nr:TetR/AcrR family transcriptional regulator [Natronincola peptidivorans]SET35064.1 transcriptional regulator, TetR family [Natronincola peptidivorans]
MPKETFYNLSEDKKQKIFDAAVQEFSTKRFSEASINQIIKFAGIPRGSFYQYFTDKEDIYSYVWEEITREKRAVLRHKETLDPDIDFFEALIQSTKATFEWSKLKPQYNQISVLMEIDNSEFITKLRDSLLEDLRGMVERDKERGLVKPETDADLVVDMIYTLIWKQLFMNGMNEDMFSKKLNNGIKIIKEGITSI